MSSGTIGRGYETRPLVGRARELKVLGDALDALSDGTGGSVLVTAPAGGGTTRVLSYLARRAAERGFLVGSASGWAGGGTPPWWPWHDLLRQVGVAPAPLGSSSTSLQDRFEMFRSVLDGIAARAVVQPVVLIVDDLHLLDPGALLLLRYVVRSLGAVPLLVICAVKSDGELEDAVAAHVDDIRRAGPTLHLAPLRADDIRVLLDRSAPTGSDDDVGAVLALTGGNPLLVDEVLAADLGTGFLPSAGTSLIERRLAPLSGPTRDLLTTMAVVDEPVNAAFLAALSGRRSVDVDRALVEGREAGLVRLEADGRTALAHRFLAGALLEAVDQSERARRHDRIADIIERDHPNRAAVATRHRLRAGVLEPTAERARAALRRCDAAVRALTGARAFETAADLVERTVELCDDVDVDVPGSFVLEAARNHLASGALRRARPWFRRVADDPRSTATEIALAAIGLGGIWVHEHRGVVEHAEFISLVERARRGLGDERPDLAARLDLRLAVERIYTREGSAADVDDALLALRRSGCRQGIAEGLSLVHHTMLGPACAGPDRRALAEEVVRAAADADDPVTCVMGALWRAVDLILAGDVRADRALAEARIRADALQVQAVLYVLDEIDVMRDLRAGRVDAAAGASTEAFRRGCDIGDADAVGYYGGQLLVIGWLRLRDLDELLLLARRVASAPTLVEGDLAPRAAAATLAAMCGQRAAAQADLDTVLAAPLRPRVSSNHLITLFCAAEAARVLNDRQAAQTIYAALAPYAALPVIGSLGVVCVGSVERSLAIAASTFGDVELALGHFERAARENHRLGNLVMAAITEGELAVALLQRGDRTDTERARALGERASATLSSMNLVERSQRLRRELDALIDQRTSTPALVQHESGWTLRWRGREVSLPDSVGVRRLAQILARPWSDIDAAELAGEVLTEAHHEVHDASALAAYRRRIDELRAEIDRHEANADLGNAEVARQQLDDLLDALATTMGRTGRSRRFIDAGERARVTVRKSLRRVLDAIEAQDPQLAKELAACIHTGHVCRFEPAADVQLTPGRGG